MAKVLRIYPVIFLMSFIYLLSGASVCAFGQTPKIGLTLSGGGAKGLAHIGVLQILDSAGIKVDYISGTSMGSIIGGMLAVGYSVDEIENFAMTIDWDKTFSSRLSPEYVHPGRREDYYKYVVQLPLEKGKLKFPNGVIEGQQLWNTLNEVFFSEYSNNDFSKFPIPFACVATDVETGESKVFHRGELVKCIRASMAIPSVFTTVEIDGRKYIDGGVVNNFPVDVVKEMGADLIIGVNVNEGLRSADELKTPIDIIMQMGLYQDSRVFLRNKKMADVVIEPDLKDYSPASFYDAANIIERGKQAGRLIYPKLKHLADSIAALRSDSSTIPPRHFARAVVVDSVHYIGLNKVRSWFVRNTMDIHPGQKLSAYQFSGAINRAFATDYFNRITYELSPGTDTSHATANFVFDEKPFGQVGLSINYNTFAGVGLVGNISTNRFLYYNMTAYAKLLVGEKPCYSTGIDYYLSDKQIRWFRFESTGNYFNFPIYENFKAYSEYQQFYNRISLSYNRITGKKNYVSFGYGSYFQNVKPKINYGFQIDGSFSSSEFFLQWHHNSLNRPAFAQKGHNITLLSAFFFNQEASLSMKDENGIAVSFKDLGIEIKNYLQVKLNWESYIPITSKLSSFSQIQAGYNFNYKQDFINPFNLGGTNSFLKNQMVFSGLNEYEIMSKGIASLALGWRYNVMYQFYISPVMNAAVYNFDLENPVLLNKDNFVLGAGINFEYLSAIGPVSVTVSYSPQTKKILSYINMGWSF